MAEKALHNPVLPPLQWHVPLLPSPPHTGLHQAQSQLKSCCCFWLGCLSPKYSHISPLHFIYLCPQMSPHQTGILWPASLKSNPKLYQCILLTFLIILPPLDIVLCIYMCINLLSLSLIECSFYKGKKNQKYKLWIPTRP